MTMLLNPAKHGVIESATVHMPSTTTVPCGAATSIPILRAPEQGGRSLRQGFALHEKMRGAHLHRQLFVPFRSAHGDDPCRPCSFRPIDGAETDRADPD